MAAPDALFVQNHEVVIQQAKSEDSLTGDTPQPRHSSAITGPPPTSGADKTFRVRGMPLDWSVDRLQTFLGEQDGAVDPAVQSLAKEVHGRSQTATVSFHTVPVTLRASQDGRPVQMSLLGNSKQLARQHLMMVDDSFHGITTLYAPPSKSHKADIIAISGLGGHAFGSFRERGGKHMWLRDALPHDLTGEDDENPFARVMVYGYDTKVAQSESIQSIEDLGTAFHSSILQLATAAALKPIIFIGHSLGGLIVKETIISLSKSKNEEDQRLAQATYGVVFFGVPHDGIDVSSLIPMAGDGPNRPLIESIGKGGSQTLGRLHRGFHEALEPQDETEIFCFFETLMSPTAVQLRCIDMKSIYDKNGNWSMKGPLAVLVTKPSATLCRPQELSAEHICAINRTHSEMVKFRPEDAEYEKVLPRIKGLAHRAIKKRGRRLRQDSNDPPGGHWLVPFGRNKDFIGREEILNQLLSLIPPAEERDNCQRTAIEGLGGVGKTQIALEVAYRIHELYPTLSVFWVPAVDANSFDNAFREIGQRLNIKGIDDDKANVRALVQAALSQSIEEWLLIIDNTDDVQLLAGDGGLRDSSPSAERGAMSESEAAELFKRSLGVKRVQDSQTMAELLEFVAYLPLAIKQASAYMDQTGMSMARYLELCQSSNKTFVKLLGKQFEDLGRYKTIQNSIATTWLISFSQISEINLTAAKLLQFMSFLAKDIPKSLLPPGEDELELEEAIGTLKAYAFITERTDQRSYEMHRLV
ncbi:hypothetical protein N0V90_004857 [Kalmusia sp. IMI 367209]|nr:hypothetical protein N0V90_004857 [Kalmusia sp. IMI 367209]